MVQPTQLLRIAPSDIESMWALNAPSSQNQSGLDQARRQPGSNKQHRDCDNDLHGAERDLLQDTLTRERADERATRAHGNGRNQFLRPRKVLRHDARSVGDQPDCIDDDRRDDTRGDKGFLRKAGFQQEGGTQCPLVAGEAAEGTATTQ